MFLGGSMEPEFFSVTPHSAKDTATKAESPTPLATPPTEFLPPIDEYRGLRWIFIGSEGLRAGWSAVLFLILTVLFMASLGSVANAFAKSLHHVKTGVFGPTTAIIGELVSFLSILCAGALMAVLEQRRLLNYYLAGSRRTFYLLSGLAAGVVSLSALVGALAWGGWLQFGPVALSGAAILKYAALWGAAFLLTGLFEEGSFRCYLQFTLARGINFWWALGIVGAVCLDLLLTIKGNGALGVYVFALLGLAPCLLLHLKKVDGAGFWQAAWVTSTLFGFIHISNNGENWVGIFAAALVGFVFCVSVRLTGSAWWAIGWHAGWDWAETYFYGAADSGNVASGHLLTTDPIGNAIWSGGTNGPEGSLLVLPIILLVLVTILAIYGRGRNLSLELPVRDTAA
jgi:uncharacterized protein